MQVNSRSLDIDLQHNEDSAERTATYVSFTDQVVMRSLLENI